MLPGVQASGEAKYTGSYGYGSSLHAYPVLSTRALATVESMDASAALQVGMPTSASDGLMPALSECGEQWHVLMTMSVTATQSFLAKYLSCRGLSKMGSSDSFVWHALQPEEF